MNPHERAFVQKVTFHAQALASALCGIVAIALGMSLAGYAQELLEVKCTVVDEMGAVIPHAEVAFVAFKGNSSTIVSRTGLDGVAAQELGTGGYIVSVSHAGFVTTKLIVKVEGATPPDCRIVLRVGDRPTDGPDRRPAEHIEFPQIKEWSSVRMSLRRTGCFGTCPSYTVTVLGNGSVIYHGDGFVHYCGDYRGNVSQQVVHQLVDVFRQADYFRLFSRYVSSATDLPTYITSIAFDDKAMSVTDYWGRRMGMPDVVTDVENTIDRLAGPKVWAKETDAHSECESGLLPVTISHLPDKIE